MRKRLSSQELAKQKAIINENIRSKQVRVIGEDYNQIVDTKQALHLAKQQGKDLVCVNIKADPPICKIIDFGKHLYDLKKKQKEQDKKNRQNAVDTKEIQFRPSIGIGDVQVKAKKIQEILDGGDKVKLVMKMRGREIGMKDFCNQRFKFFLENVKKYEFDSQPKWIGNKVLAILKKEC